MYCSHHEQNVLTMSSNGYSPVTMSSDVLTMSSDVLTMSRSSSSTSRSSRVPQLKLNGRWPRS